jgi:hypothetical protein
MSSLWTPSGEHRVDDQAAAGGSKPAPEQVAAPGEGPDDAAQDLDELRRQLARTPAEAVIANHCYGLFELASVYLTQSPPLLDQARLSIDAFGLLVEGMADRLGEAGPSLRQALAQIRVAFVRLEQAQGLADEQGAAAPGD